MGGTHLPHVQKTPGSNSGIFSEWRQVEEMGKKAVCLIPWRAAADLEGPKDQEESENFTNYGNGPMRGLNACFANKRLLMKFLQLKKLGKCPEGTRLCTFQGQPISSAPAYGQTGRPKRMAFPRSYMFPHGCFFTTISLFP